METEVIFRIIHRIVTLCFNAPPPPTAEEKAGQRLHGPSGTDGSGKAQGTRFSIDLSIVWSVLFLGFCCAAGGGLIVWRSTIPTWLIQPVSQLDSNHNSLGVTSIFSNQHPGCNTSTRTSRPPPYPGERGAGHGMGRGHTITREIGWESEQYSTHNPL